MIKQIIKYRREINKYKSISTEVSLNWKYFIRWRKTMQANKNSIEIGMPWFTFPAIDFISSHLSENSNIFEFGGGGSTVYFLGLGHRVTTAEHHEEWFDRMQKALSVQKKWTGLFCPADFKTNDSPLNPSVPEDYYTTDENYLHHIFKSYASSIDRFPEESFDMVLVDGRSRPSCIEHAVPKIKVGGYLIIDNTEREYYLTEFLRRYKDSFDLILNTYGPVPYVDWFNQTTIYKKNR